VNGVINMAVEVYLNFNGNCREAVEFYAHAFDIEKQNIMTYGDAPANPDFQVAKEAKDLILHTFLMIGGSRVMFSDVFPGSDFIVGNNINLAVMSKDIEKVKAYFNHLKEGGTIQMDLQETFFSKCYGVIKDQFGITWQIGYDNY
jgi:PhnB protein